MSQPLKNYAGSYMLIQYCSKFLINFFGWQLARRWYPDVLKEAPRKKLTHRALEDIKESVAELKYYRSNLFK